MVIDQPKNMLAPAGACVCRIGLRFQSPAVVPNEFNTRAYVVGSSREGLFDCCGLIRTELHALIYEARDYWVGRNTSVGRSQHYQECDCLVCAVHHFRYSVLSIPCPNIPVYYTLQAHAARTD